MDPKSCPKLIFSSSEHRSSDFLIFAPAPLMFSWFLVSQASPKPFKIGPHHLKNNFDLLIHAPSTYIKKEHATDRGATVSGLQKYTATHAGRTCARKMRKSTIFEKLRFLIRKSAKFFALQTAPSPHSCTHTRPSHVANSPRRKNSAALTQFRRREEKVRKNH